MSNPDRSIDTKYLSSELEKCIESLRVLSEEASTLVEGASQYARSMLCLVLGFRASLDAIPFLMQQVEVFETRFPSETFDQGPVLALSELKARFRTV